MENFHFIFVAILSVAFAIGWVVLIVTSLRTPSASKRVTPLAAQQESAPEDVMESSDRYIKRISANHLNRKQRRALAKTRRARA